MHHTSKNAIKELLLKHGASPSKRMGQHFLVHSPTLDTMVKAAELTGEDTVLEIGPGIGTLTLALAERARKVIAIEKDRSMVKILKETLREHGNAEVIEGNALTFDPIRYNLKAKSYKIVANIPYYLTSPLIRKFLEARKQPRAMVLMIQKEVAQRICASPPHMSILSVSVQFYAKPRIISYVKKEYFWPMPQVDSAVINIIPRKKIPVDEKLFFRMVKAGFSQPRKQLAGNLSQQLKKDRQEINQWLEKINIDPTQRAETLTILDWEKLTTTFR